MKTKNCTFVGLIAAGFFISTLTASVKAATFTVDITADDANAHDVNPGDGVCSDALSSCTLRAAIEEANATAAPDQILFADSFVNARLLLAASEGPLPPITNQVFILGDTIDAYNTSASLLSDAPPQFTVDGSNLTSGSGLVFSGAGASDSLVSALSVVNFPGDGVQMVLSAEGIRVDQCYIGVNPDGSPGGMGLNGIVAFQTDDHTIGQSRNSSAFVGLGNVISSNGNDGIKLLNSDGNQVLGNWLGIRASGAGGLGNEGYGLSMVGHDNQVGDFVGTEVAGNFFGGNGEGGLIATGNNNIFLANTLGQGQSGGFINSEKDGIKILGELNIIGGLAELAKNRIYQHTGAGIRLGEFGVQAGNNNFVLNNQVGSAGSQFPSMYATNGEGILVTGNTNIINDNVVINSSEDGAAPGYFGNAITVRGNDSSINGNQIGFIETIVGGVANEPNEGGILVFGDGNSIGSELKPNVVAGNSGLGVFTRGMDNDVSYNYIGVTPASEILGNDGFGIQMDHQGGGMVVRHNFIGDNTSDGLRLDTPVNTLNLTQNVIGVLPNGLAAGNQGSGVNILGAEDIDLAFNTIANNSLDGIRVVNDSSGVAIFRNSIYNNDQQGIDLGNDGITANDVGDFDEGDNRLQNTPVIEEVVFDETVLPRTLTIRYRVDSSDSINASAYPLFIDFYWNPVDESAQGKHFISTDFNYTTPNTVKTVIFDFDSSATGGYLTATALDQDRNTSEFAAQVPFGEIDLIFKDGFEE